MTYHCGLARLTVIRHGQSTANVLFAEAEETGDPALAVPERTDAGVPLSRWGVRQARAVGRWFARLSPADRPEIVVCSPYLRAVQTWDAVAVTAREANVPAADALIDERLRDREMGALELMTGPAIRERAVDEAARRERVGEWFYRPPGGESLADVTVRVRDFLNEVRVPAAGRHVLLVTHDSVAAAVRRVLAGVGAPPPDPEPVRNASVSTWEGDGTRMRLSRFGAVDHLEGSGTG